MVKRAHAPSNLSDILDRVGKKTLQLHGRVKLQTPSKWFGHHKKQNKKVSLIRQCYQIISCLKHEQRELFKRVRGSLQSQVCGIKHHYITTEGSMSIINLKVCNKRCQNLLKLLKKTEKNPPGCSSITSAWHKSLNKT